jgi:hypothetical protein
MDEEGVVADERFATHESRDVNPAAMLGVLQ